MRLLQFRDFVRDSAPLDPLILIGSSVKNTERGFNEQ